MIPEELYQWWKLQNITEKEKDIVFSPVLPEVKHHKTEPLFDSGYEALLQSLLCRVYEKRKGQIFFRNHSIK